MCDALRQLLKEEIEEEKRNAVQSEAQKAERALLGTIKNLMVNLKLSADQVMSAMEIPAEKRAEYRAKL